MAGIFRDAQFNDIFERLCDQNASNCERPIFKNYIDLVVFAAVVGFSKRKMLEPVERVNEIPQRVFQNQNVDGLVYLLAVLGSQSGEMFRERNDAECWRMFEWYANGGLQVIREVFAENPNDFDGVSSLLNFIKDEAVLQAERQM